MPGVLFVFQACILHFQNGPEGVGVTVEVVEFVGIADAPECADGGRAGFFGGVKCELPEEAALSVAFEKINCLGQTEEPLVTVHRSVEGKAVVLEAASTARDRLSGC